MSWTAYVVAALALAALLAPCVTWRSSARLARIEQQVDRVLSTLQTGPAPLSLESILHAAVGNDTPLNRQDVVVQPVRDNQVIVYGKESQARALGSVRGAAPQLLRQAARHAGKAAEAGIEAAKQTGYLVELAPESAKAMREFNQVSDGFGNFLGVLRDGDTKFRHVLKLKEASRVKAFASGAAVLSALAAQAQLDEIERQLGQISRDIHDLQGAMEDRREAELLGAMRLLQEVYEAARATHALTPAMWAQVAPLAHTVYTLQEESRLRLERVLKQVHKLSSSAKQRADQLEAALMQAQGALRLVLDEERAVVQFQLLRVWHLATTNDPSLADALARLEQDSRRRRDLMVALSTSVADALDDPDVQGWLQRMRIWTRRKISGTAKELQEFVETSSAGIVELPMITPPRTIDESGDLASAARR